MTAQQVPRGCNVRGGSHGLGKPWRGHVWGAMGDGGSPERGALELTHHLKASSNTVFNMGMKLTSHTITHLKLNGSVAFSSPQFPVLCSQHSHPVPTPQENSTPLDLCFVSLSIPHSCLLLGVLIIFTLMYLFCVCVCVCAWHGLHMDGGLFSFYHVCSGARTQVLSLGCNHPYSLSCLTDPSERFLEGLSELTYFIGSEQHQFILCQL